KLSNRASVGTFYVVGEDFQLGFRIYRSVIINQNIVVLLKGINLLCNLVHENFSIENSGRTFGKYPFVILVAFTIWRFMVHQSIVVHMLFSFKNGHPF